MTTMHRERMSTQHASAATSDPTPAAGGRLLPPLEAPTGKEAIRFGERALTYEELAGAVAAVARVVAGASRVAVFAESRLETCVAAVGALEAGVAFTPINPKAGERELEHIVSDSTPELLLTAPGVELPPALQAIRRVDVDADARCRRSPIPRRPR